MRTLSAILSLSAAILFTATGFADPVLLPIAPTLQIEAIPSDSSGDGRVLLVINQLYDASKVRPVNFVPHLPAGILVSAMITGEASDSSGKTMSQSQKIYMIEMNNLNKVVLYKSDFENLPNDYKGRAKVGLPANALFSVVKPEASH